MVSKLDKSIMMYNNSDKVPWLSFHNTQQISQDAPEDHTTTRPSLPQTSGDRAGHSYTSPPTNWSEHQSSHTPVNKGDQFLPIITRIAQSLFSWHKNYFGGKGSSFLMWNK